MTRRQNARPSVCAAGCEGNSRGYDPLKLSQGFLDRLAEHALARGSALL